MDCLNTTGAEIGYPLDKKLQENHFLLLKKLTKLPQLPT